MWNQEMHRGNLWKQEKQLAGEKGHHLWAPSSTKWLVYSYQAAPITLGHFSIFDRSKGRRPNAFSSSYYHSVQWKKNLLNIFHFSHEISSRFLLTGEKAEEHVLLFFQRFLSLPWFQRLLWSGSHLLVYYTLPWEENLPDSLSLSFTFCQISVNTSISLDHPKCILFRWLIFHIISKQKDNTDKSSTKTCHETRYWKKKRHWNRPK